MNYVLGYLSRENLVLYNILSSAIEIITTYLSLNLILWIFGKKVALVRRLVFSVFIVSIIQIGWEYLTFYVLKTSFLADIAPIFYTFPVPLLAFSCYYLGLVILKLDKPELFRIMTVYYLFYAILRKITNFAYFTIPLSNDLNYWYLSKLIIVGVSILAVLVVINIFTSKVLKNIRKAVSVGGKSKSIRNRDYLTYIINSILAYAAMLLINIALKFENIANLLGALTCTLFLVAYVLLDYKQVLEADNELKEVQAQMLLEGTNDFKSVKHDFYNILQTYSGYLMLDDIERLKKYHSNLLNITLKAGTKLELSKKMKKNPVLISLLMNKLEYAETLDVHMRISIQSDINDFYINDLDLSRCLICLLDNAIEAASEAEEKKVYFSIEPSGEHDKCILITNSTKAEINPDEIFKLGFTTKTDHSGLGLANVKKILAQYENCKFSMSYEEFRIITKILIEPTA